MQSIRVSECVYADDILVMAANGRALHENGNVLNKVIRTCSQKSTKINLAPKKMQSIRVSECVYADDILVMAANGRALHENGNVRAKELNKNRMIISPPKTKVMVECRLSRPFF
ncbi:hypothetical protein QE152_g29540 [Popillia japonica]|uniref:Reverse transcriptase domain-containing protein n=1 Tax=Popillia japonica TaxID=7064 RepID=A0AAW1JHR1_POPJA